MFVSTEAGIFRRLYEKAEQFISKQAWEFAGGFCAYFKKTQKICQFARAVISGNFEDNQY